MPNRIALDSEKFVNLCREKNVELSEEDLDRISGGQIYWNENEKAYEIIDHRTGKVLEKDIDDYVDAVSWCWVLNVPNGQISEEEIMQLRRADALRVHEPDDGGFRSM